jgi:hypothetical protein
MVLYYEWGSTTEHLEDADLRTAVRSVLEKLGQRCVRGRGARLACQLMSMRKVS